MLDAVIALGLSLALVVVIVAAFADPEPATKLALAGLSAVMITALFQKLGIKQPPKTQA